MDKTGEKTIEVLNDLILINSDRSTAYEKAMRQIGSIDVELFQTFKTFAAESHKYLYELAGHLDPSGQELLKGIPTTNGKIYAAWENAKTIFNEKDRQALLVSSEICEKAIQKAYDEALNVEIPEEIKQIIAEQRNDLGKAFDRISKLHEVQQA